MQRDANEVTRAAVRALLERCAREAAFELARWALQLRREG
jgi:hypothetical protein